MKTEILFPEVANLCGDLMNVTYLRQSCPEMEVVETGLKDRPAFLDGGVDLVYVGSATERGLQLMVQALTPYKAELERYVDGGWPPATPWTPWANMWSSTASAPSTAWASSPPTPSII